MPVATEPRQWQSKNSKLVLLAHNSVAPAVFPAELKLESRSGLRDLYSVSDKEHKTQGVPSQSHSSVVTHEVAAQPHCPDLCFPGTALFLVSWK